MSKFYVPQRYNKETAENGQWFRIEQDGVYGGKYKLKLMDVYNQRQMAEVNRCRESFGQELSDDERGRNVLFTMFLLDWELPVDPNAPKNKKPIPYSVKEANEFFALEETAWILSKISEIFMDTSRFNNPLKPETTEKNS